MSREPYIIRDETGRDRIRDLVGGLDMSKPWSIIVEPYRKKRSLSQNALYWRWIGLVAQETGNANDDVHEAFKAKFCPPRTIKMGDDERDIRSTAKLTTADMQAYMDAVYAFVTTELGMLLPIPEELGRDAA